MNLTLENRGGSPFVSPDAVEAWDTWFRWRENGALRDETVDATWRRIAATLAAAEADDARIGFELRLLDAFASWRVLLDERLLATAGTNKEAWPGNDLVAVLNVAGFVRAADTPAARIDFAAMKDSAALAVHALDNALLLGNDTGAAPKKLRVGVIGLAEAFALLGLDYAGAEARAQAQSVAQSLAEGCLRATVALAETRGATLHCDTAWIEQAQQRGMPAGLIERARLHGVRHTSLTAITLQPRLAKFANDTSDAVLPLTAGDALLAYRGSWPNLPPAASVPAQLEMRGAMQPWIDEPVACPVRSYGRPVPANHADWYARSAALGLGALSWVQ